jgi:hypothetical protein
MLTTNAPYRIQFHTITYTGRLQYRIERRSWFWWKPVSGPLWRDEAEKALQELRRLQAVDGANAGSLDPAPVSR